ncbi:hypothetical protein [Rossellomorea sp. BNER]|uniref:hypothetical protein n=1 Tax=Rossellomorea sp. BNER TaxID=2962031 RepID=UPI003AF2193E|nr:hypothetical protein [Rossellomorea sp. BNER]
MSKYISGIVILLTLCYLLYIEKDLFKMEFYTEQEKVIEIQNESSQEIKSVHFQVKTQPIGMKIHFKTDLNDKILMPMYYIYKIVKSSN